jgi:hypothetical protein
MDDRVAKFLDTRTDKATKASESDDEDALLEELENEDGGLDGLREKRMQQLHEEYGFLCNEVFG